MDGVTVKQAVELLKGAEDIKISLGDSDIIINQYNTETLQVFGGYICDSIIAFEKHQYRITLKTVLVKK